MATITDKGMQAKPGIKDKWLTDSLGRGGGALLARITPAGERLFYFRHTDSTGARKLLPIGPYHPKGAGGLTLAQARERAADLSLTYRDGVKDLRQHFERQAAERERQAEEVRRVAEVEARRVTVRGLFKQWQRSALSPQTTADGTRTGRKDGGEWVRQSFERRVFPAIGDVPADEVTRAQLLAILDDAKAQGVRRTANVLLTDLQQMFRFAAEREIVRASPLAGVSRKSIGGKDTERDRVLSVDEIQQLAASLPSARMSPRSIAAVWLILATAVRVSEAMGANWAHVDLEARTWHLPTTKNQRDHTIHLSDFAVRQFEKLAELREAGSRWVFPSTADSDVYVTTQSFGKQLADRQREPGTRLSHRSLRTESLVLPGGKWTAHDLRRTAATLMSKLGVSTDVIDECLNHKVQSKVARIYIRDRREPDQARAFDKLGELLETILSRQGGGANVVPLIRKA